MQPTFFRVAFFYFNNSSAHTALQRSPPLQLNPNSLLRFQLILIFQLILMGRKNKRAFPNQIPPTQTAPRLKTSLTLPPGEHPRGSTRSAQGYRPNPPKRGFERSRHPIPGRGQDDPPRGVTHGSGARKSRPTPHSHSHRRPLPKFRSLVIAEKNFS